MIPSNVFYHPPWKEDARACEFMSPRMCVYCSAMARSGFLGACSCCAREPARSIIVGRYARELQKTCAACRESVIAAAAAIPPPPPVDEIRQFFAHVASRFVGSVKLDGVMRIAELYSLARQAWDEWPDARDSAWEQNKVWRVDDPMWPVMGVSLPATAEGVRNYLNMKIPAALIMTWDPIGAAAHGPRRFHMPLRPIRGEQATLAEWNAGSTLRAHVMTMDELEFDDDPARTPAIVITRFGFVLATRVNERRPLALFLLAVNGEMVRTGQPFWCIIIGWTNYFRYLRMEAMLEPFRREKHRAIQDDGVGGMVHRHNLFANVRITPARVKREFRGRWHLRYDTIPLVGHRIIAAIFEYLLRGVSRLVDEVFRPRLAYIDAGEPEIPVHPLPFGM